MAKHDKKRKNPASGARIYSSGNKVQPERKYLNYFLWIPGFLMFCVVYKLFNLSVDLSLTQTGKYMIICWGLFFGMLCVLLPRRISMAVIPLLWLSNTAMLFAQYAYYKIFQSFFMLQSMTLAGEGAVYLDTIFDYISIKVMVCYIIAGFGGSIFLIFLMKFKAVTRKKHDKIFALAACICCAATLITLDSRAVSGFQKEADQSRFDAVKQPYYVYTKATNPYMISELTCYYQYLTQFTKNQIARHSGKQHAACVKTVNDFFEGRKEPSQNSMSGILKGKNVILVMMESMDDWLVNERNTPNIVQMERDGINFTNFYTSIYGSARTYNTEFCLLSGLYAPDNGIPACSYSNNRFNRSLPNLLKQAGYSANEYHKSEGSYYNRAAMSRALGLDSYYSLKEHNIPDFKMDTSLTENDTVYNELVSGQPFFDMIVTYTPHLKYTYKDNRTKKALKKHPEYRTLTDNEQINSASAKAKITDDMFGVLLKRLRQDNLLDDTVIIGVSDHYTYGLSDKNLKTVTGTDDINLNSRNVCFMYGGGLDQMTVDKTVNTADLLPTLLNMLGISRSKYYIGQDIFDDSYSGYAIFDGGDWITADSYYSGGKVSKQFSDRQMTEQEIEDMNKTASDFIKVNTAMVDGNYYGE